MATLFDKKRKGPVRRWTAAETRSCIQNHFGIGGQKYAVLFEVRNGTAWRADRSVDAVVMSLWPSLGMELWGMEIKTARNDWRREIDNPAKASAMFDHFDRFWLVAPESIVQPDEVPQPWGWFVPIENGGLQKVRDAAKNAHVKPLDRHFLAAILRRASKTDDDFVSAAVASAIIEQKRTDDSEIESRVLDRLGTARGDAAAWTKLRDALKEKPDDYFHQPEVLQAIRIIVKSGIANSYGCLRNFLDAAESVRKNIGPLAAELGIKASDR